MGKKSYKPEPRTNFWISDNIIFHNSAYDKAKVVRKGEIHVRLTKHSNMKYLAKTLRKNNHKKYYPNVLFQIHPWKGRRVPGLKYLQTSGMSEAQTIFDSLLMQQRFVHFQGIQCIRKYWQHSNVEMKSHHTEFVFCYR